jgi:hypothetical protein
MPAYFPISNCFSIFSLLAGVLVLTGSKPQQLSYSEARPVALPRFHRTQARPDESRRDLFGR